MEGVKRFIDEGFSPDTVLKCEWTPIMYAANNASPKITEYLIQKGANVNSHKDMYSVLMAACGSTAAREDDVYKCVKLLIDNGANVNGHDRYHMSPLIYAAREGRASVVEVLLDAGAAINKQDSRGWTALSWASSKNHVKVVKLLVERKADIHKKHCDGQSVMDIAVTGDFQEIMALLGGKPFTQMCPAGDRNLLPSVQQHTTNNNKEIFTDTYSNNEDPTDSQSSVMKYGELELFLSGLDLGHFIGLFQQHQIDFATLLRSSDDDLCKMGIQQLGVRKKILDGIHGVHKKDWERSSLPSMDNGKKLSCADAVAIMSNISKHTKYISSTLTYICGQMSASSEMIKPQDGITVKDLQTHTRSTISHVELLQKEVCQLDATISKLLSSQNLDPPDIVNKRKTKRTRLNYKRLLTVTVMSSAICIVIYKRQDIQKVLTSIFHVT
ncbi:hypothetical protein FSP39_002709 [Pinctada imbricata]|uniref:Ankyrin repeat, SAM and basic leucine zipper domain-containing protein 1 n=1 Tax=Pinctada imbricata TaxID=66713 RepID=A0AA89C9R0_PINIB|nr:hypothetical protein FSP39_002709 [Pinctada imbricata]